MQRRAHGVVLLAMAIPGAFEARAQDCSPIWQTPYQRFDTSGEVRAQVIFDDGSGPTLYIGGGFFIAGGVGTRGVARWTGSDWEALGDGLTGEVFTLAVFDDGSGPALYAGGNIYNSGGAPISRVAKWTGSSWAGVGDGLDYTVRGLASFDDGSGPALYAAGTFARSGSGAGVAGIARLSGTTWEPVGGGLHTLAASGSVSDGVGYALGAFDEDGPGPSPPRLIVAGDFNLVTAPIQQQADGIAAWDGAGWSPLGGGLGDSDGSAGWGLCLHARDEAAGPALYVGGLFDSAGTGPAANIAKWQGGAWSPLGAGFDNFVSAITTFDAGGGADLYAGGVFAHFGDDPSTFAGRIARWDGAAWHTLGDGVGSVNATEYVRTVGVFDLGSGPSLMVGGDFHSAGGDLTSNLARWDGGAWHHLGNGFRYGPRTLVSLTEHGRESIYSFVDSSDRLDGKPIGPLIRFDGATWATVAQSPLVSISDLGAADSGDGKDLFVIGSDGVRGGLFRRVAGVWGLMPSPDGQVGLPVAVEGGVGRMLYAALRNTQDDYAIRLARWDGARWRAEANSTLATRSVSAVINDLVVFDDRTGYGPAVYAAGNFRTVGGADSPAIAKWEGARWTPLGAGLRGPQLDNVYAYDMEIYDDGQGEGPALYVCGNFETAGGVTARGIARWNGRGWSAVGGPMSELAWGSALTVFDDGSGPSLLLSGTFTSIGGVSAPKLAKWNGREWSPLVTSVGPTDSSVFWSFAPLDAHGLPSLWASGQVGSVNGHSATGIVQLIGCPDPCSADWNHSGHLDSTDFFDYVGSFFAGGGEFNADGATNTQDFFDFLNAYFAGCR